MTVLLNRKATVQDRFKIFLNMIAAYYNIRLAEQEVTILNEFYWKSAGKITKESKKEVMESLGITDYNLNNYLLKLRRKKLIDDQGITERLIINVAPAERSFGMTFILES